MQRAARHQLANISRPRCCPAGQISEESGLHPMQRPGLHAYTEMMMMMMMMMEG